MMKTSLQIAAWGGMFIAIYGVLFAEFGITLIFGAEYKAASRIFAVLIWVIPLALMSGHFRYTLIGYDRQKFEFLSALIGAGVNVMLNLVLVGRYGLFGAAVSLVISEAVIWLTTYLYVRRLIVPIPVLVYIWKPVVAGAMLSAALYFLMKADIFHVFLAGAIGLVVYVFLMAVFQPDIFVNMRLIFQRSGGEQDG
jgi:O-antigen/teichoic acid export membrane protein